MDAAKKTINDIFNGNRRLEIPFFQRAYVWGESEWERFLTDMEDVSKNNQPYFLGSVILKQQLTVAQNSIGDIRTVVDGQQRLTTLNIFFKVLCLRNDINSQFERVFKLIDNNVALLHNHNDIDSFERILELINEDNLTENDNITRAYSYFKEKINSDKLSFQRILKNVMFVGIDLGVDEDEQQIFDTINSLGVRLTTAELLKNYLFNRDDLESYNDNWKDVFEGDSDTKEFWDREITTGRTKRSNVDLFLYSFLQIKIQSPSLTIKATDKDMFGKVEGLFDSYKKFISEYNINKLDIILEIKEYATIYRKYIDHSVVERQLTDRYGIDRINAIIFGLESSTIIPYLLYILKNVTDSHELALISKYLEAFILRRIVCRETSKNYNQLFSEQLIINEILSYKQLRAYIEGLSDKINRMPSDSDLEYGFNESKLINKQAAGVLYFIESKIRDRNLQSTALLGLKQYSLEHVMPKKWANNWEDVDGEEARMVRNRMLLTLGNLTIITASLNSSIRDSNWNVKKEGVKKKRGLKYYSAGIEVIREYLDREEWNEDVIGERSTYLYEHARKIWTIE